MFVRLTKEQEKIATQKPNSHSLVKGVAGSGKTTVGIYKILYLLNNYCFENDDSILFATFNKTLINYVSYIYKKVEDDSNKNIFKLFDLSSKQISISTVDSLMYSYYKNYCKKTNVDYKVGLVNNDKFKIIKEGISKLRKTYQNVSILEHKNVPFLLEEINWIKYCYYLNEEEYQTADRLGKMKSKEGHYPQRLAKNSDTRRSIFELMLFYTQKTKELGYIDYPDMEIVALKEIRKNPKKRYTHIIVDETQDLSRVQLLFLKELSLTKDYSSITFIGDTAQSIYSQSWLGAGRNFTTIDLDMTGRSKSLSKNFRTTTQISQAAYSLLEKDESVIENENFVKPFLIDKQGEYPVYKELENKENQVKNIKSLLENELKKYNHKDISIIARTKNQLTDFKIAMEEKGVKCHIINKNDTNFEDEALKLLTMHSIKGLEFKVVIIIDLNDGIVPYLKSSSPDEKKQEESSERKLFYVGMTRATELLYLFSSSNPSCFIKDIDPKYLKLDANLKIKPFYNISTDNFLYKEKIVNINNVEEKVRQWVIAELMETYKYPKELIEIEAPIKLGSKTLFADIMVSRYINMCKKSFIIIETKALNNNLIDGREQLQSYMKLKDSDYGVCTNGKGFEVFDVNGNNSNDIPDFSNHMLTNNLEYISYKNLIKNTQMLITVDNENPTEIEVNYNGIFEEYKNENLKKLNIYGKIAAGTPIFMNPDLLEEIFLPKEWFKSGNYFSLKIKGDSMINAGIEDGDCVVLKEQDYAENMDIVAVALDDCATLKTFRKMGDSVLLVPENPKYEPIPVDKDYARIFGIAVGVIKKINQCCENN